MRRLRFPVGRRAWRIALAWTCLGLLSSLPTLARTAAAVTAGELPLRIVMIDAGGGAHASRDGHGVVLPPDGGRVRFRIEFDLPPTAADSPPWVLRFNRVELKELSLQAPDWRPPARDFFHPDPGDGWLPASFAQPLPGDWRGPVAIEVVAATDLVRTLRPQLLREPLAVERDRVELVIAMALYGGLLALALTTLALLLGARQKVFLGLLGLIAAVLLLALVVRGHAYAVPGLRWLAALGGQGTNLATLLMCASGVAVARAHAGDRRIAPWFQWSSLATIAAMLLLAAACLTGIGPGPGAMHWLVTAGWIVALAVEALSFAGVGIRNGWRAWPLPAVLLPLALLGVLFELSVRGRAAEFWGSHAYLIGLALAVAALMAALTARVAGFRIRHQRERLARHAAELKLMRQSALAGLAQELRQQLPDVPLKELETNAVRIALRRVLAPLRLRSAGVVLYRAGRAVVHIVEPEAQAARIAARIEANADLLRELARRPAPTPALTLAQAVPPRRGNERPSAVWAGLPLDTGNAGSGVALLERAGRDPFTDDELALAASFAELALQQIGEARATHRLRRSAELDALTGVLNRSAIDSLLAQSFEESFLRRQPLAVLFADLDHFKSINDTWGHACGDHCLRQVAEILRGTLRSGDRIGRYGGEEFLVLLPGCNAQQAAALGERLRRAVEQAQMQWQGQRIELTISIGVSARWTYEDKPDAVGRADQALYAAKREGRNRVSQSP
ncbi:MAG: GGDEF domain-containing protein [Pseudoxanthomonas sp.]